MMGGVSSVDGRSFVMVGGCRVMVGKMTRERYHAMVRGCHVKVGGRHVTSCDGGRMSCDFPGSSPSDYAHLLVSRT